MAMIRTVRTLVLTIVPILVLMSLNFSSSRWRALQEELEKKELAHSLEVQRLEEQVAKARQASSKCSADAKDTAEKLQTRYQQKLAKLDIEVKSREEKIKKAELRLKEVEKEEKDKNKASGKMEQKMAKLEETIQSKEEELEGLKEESIAALKASRDRAGVLRRGLQGSAALLAEKNVLIEQFNVTLLSALYHMEKDQRAAAAQSAAALGLPSKERKATMQRLIAQDINLENALNAAVQIFQAQRSEHSRLAQEFVNATRAERERQEQEKEKEAQAAKAKELKMKQELSSQVVSEAASVVTVKDDASAPSSTRADAKKEPRGSSGTSGSRKAGGVNAKGGAAKTPPKVDPLEVAKSIVPVDLDNEEEQEAETTPKGDEEIDDLEDGEAIGDLEWGVGDGGEQDPEVQKQREEEEKKRQQRIDRAMQKETTRQEQAKYWAKYHKQNQKQKQSKAKSEGGEDNEGESVE